MSSRTWHFCTPSYLYSISNTDLVTLSKFIDFENSSFLLTAITLSFLTQTPSPFRTDSKFVSLKSPLMPYSTLFSLIVLWKSCYWLSCSYNHSILSLSLQNVLVLLSIQHDYYCSNCMFNHLFNSIVLSLFHNHTIESFC